MVQCPSKPREMLLYEDLRLRDNIKMKLADTKFKEKEKTK